MDHTVPEKLQDKQMVVRYVNKAGKSRIHGGAHLKGSQAYPAGLIGCIHMSCFKTGFESMFVIKSLTYWDHCGGWPSNYKTVSWLNERTQPFLLANQVWQSIVQGEDLELEKEPEVGF